MSYCIHNLVDGTCADCLRDFTEVPEPLEDWWMGNPDTSPGWRSADVVVKEMERDAERQWTPALVAIEDMMSESDRVGGITGLDLDSYRAVRAGLIKLGSAS
jgi:hypothetical protein